MKKIIKRYGSSLIVRITPDEIKIHRLKVGDIIDFKIERVKRK